MNQEKKYACRVCLNCDRDTCTGIFDKIDELFIYEKLNLIANINIKPKDGLPDKICSDCLSELENAIIFRQKCETSNNILVSAIPINIGIAKQEDDFSKELVKEEELDASTDHEYLQEEPTSPLELPLKQEESDEEKHSLELHPEPPLKPSKAINLQLECHDCGNLFKSKCKLKVHWFKTHIKAQLTCNICEKTFGSFTKLKNHKIKRTKRCATLSQVRIEREGKSRVYHCKKCTFSSRYDTTMTKHLAFHSGEHMYPCTLCPASYLYKNNYDEHMAYKHEVIKKLVVCNICGATMIPSKLNRHMKKHIVTASVKCNLCNKVLKHKHQMKEHMDRHAGVKKYACNKCEKSFTISSGVLHHVKVVHDRKVHNCNLCKFKSTNIIGMRKHKLNHSKYHYVCTTCGKFFENDKQLACHEDRHTNRNYLCEQCDKTFYTRKLLLRHVNKWHNIYADGNLRKKRDK